MPGRRAIWEVQEQGRFFRGAEVGNTKNTGSKDQIPVDGDQFSATFCLTPTAKQPVCEMVATAVERYLADLDGTEPNCIYDLVMNEVERPLLKTVLAHAGGNRSKASKYLGINRNTLRKKLEQYQIDD